MKAIFLANNKGCVDYVYPKATQERIKSLVDIDLDKVYCVPALYEEYVSGFLSEMKSSITDEEVKLLHDGAIMMTLECGMRFLTDYLEGDTYFRTHYAGQNLDRARTQMKLVQDMEARRDEFEAIIKKYI